MPLPMLMRECRLAGGSFLIWVYQPWSSSRNSCMAVMRAVTMGWAGRSARAWTTQPLKHRHGGDDFAFDALIDDGEEEGPDVGGGAEVVAAVAHAAVDLDEVPVLQFLETVADVGAGDGEGVGDVFGGEGLRRQVEQGMDLGDGAVDSPAGAHFAPVEDEFLHGVGQFHVSSISDISVMTEISDMKGKFDSWKESKADPSLTTPEPTPKS